MYGWTIHYWSPILGISLSFFMSAMPSPWQPADGLAMNTPPFFSLASSDSVSSGRR